MPRVTLPTIWHRLTLEKLINGWELVVSTFQDGKRRIYWRKASPGPLGEFGIHDTIECDSQKLRQMRFMQRRGWVQEVDSQWSVTEAGRIAYEASK